MKRSRKHATKQYFKGKFIGKRFKKSLDYYQNDIATQNAASTQNDAPHEYVNSPNSYNIDRQALADGVTTQQYLDMTQEQNPVYEKLSAANFAKAEGNGVQYDTSEPDQRMKNFQDDLNDVQTAMQQNNGFNNVDIPEKTIEQGKEAYISPNNDISGMIRPPIEKSFDNSFHQSTNQLNPYVVEKSEQGAKQSYFNGNSQQSAIDYGEASYPNEDATMKKSKVPAEESTREFQQLNPNPTPKVPVVIADKRQMLPVNATHPRKLHVLIIIRSH